MRSGWGGISPRNQLPVADCVRATRDYLLPFQTAREIGSCGSTAVPDVMR